MESIVAFICNGIHLADQNISQIYYTISEFHIRQILYRHVLPDMCQIILRVVSRAEIYMWFTILSY